MAAPKRSVQACSRCRQQKMKCSGDPAPCERCARFGRECIFEPANTNSAAPFVPRPDYQQQQPPLTPSDGSLSLDHRDPPHRSTPGGRKRSLDAASTGYSSRAARPRPPPSRHTDLLPSAATPYSSVQELETNRQIWSGGYETPSDGHSADGQRRERDSNSFGDRACLRRYLAEADITVADAQELFKLFGERIAHFIPSLYATDFNNLPTEPIYALAAIHAVARYLPDSDALRGRICRILRQLLSELILQPITDPASTAMVENMQGLVVLYSCCEATGPVPDHRQRGASFDMLTLKGIAEGYAVKLKLGLDCALGKVCGDKLPWVWVVWLYTMSHHCAVIHGCPRTLSGSMEFLRIKAALEQTVDHPRIRLLLGECELCLLWEKAFAVQGSSPQTVHEALDHWKAQWQGFLTGAAAQGRHLYFHFFFTRFHLLTHLVNESGEYYIAMGESLDAAQDFLHWVRSLSPISKDRLRYLCDFAFVLMAYVCLYTLRALRSGVVLPESQREFLRMVKDAATLMQSLGVRADTRPTVYGYALEAMCKQYQTTVMDGLSTSPALNLQEPREVSSLSRQSQVNMDLPMAAEGLMDEDILRQSRLSPGFWTLDPDLSVFDGIMAGIPVPEEAQ
ncbi:hypothetical protein BJX63DRAFT_433261 [Aspergillus granulosus]|uniref:Zn(2)-C6 fungal-type domain-containing protein n=1 Tax=Aspergillus granulosus TaxID=176169 RepID=A0ABR4H821_9EURO